MNNEKFAALVNRLEQSARRNPAVYRLQVLSLAIVGNAYLLFILLLILALFIASLASIVFLKAFAVKIIIPIAILLWAVMRALWVKVSAPEGLKMGRNDAPELFQLIDTLRVRANAPRFHQVLITNEMNAAVAQRPRLGIFGGYRNYLLIGLPLMKMLTVDQFAAVLAHEFGHLAKGHGRLSNWIYRQRIRWLQLMEWFEATGHRGSVLFTPFLNRFAPYFNAYAFPLARANEYEADAAAVRATSATVAAEALTAVHVLGSYLHEKYWPEIYLQADELPQPAFAPYQTMHGTLARELPREAIDQWLERAMNEETSLSDTHPSLTERLAAIGEQPRFAPPQHGASAERLLGPALERITREFDQTWHADIEEGWKRRYEEVAEGRKNLADLNQRLANGEELSPQENYNRAMWTESYGEGAEAALLQLEALLQRLPEEPVISYAVGVRRLGRDDETGIALVEFAMEHDADYYLPGAETLRDYHWRHGRESDALQWHERMVAREETDRLAAKERDEVTLTDKFEPHHMPEEELEQLRTQLKHIKGLGKVYLVRKQLKYNPERPLYVLGFTTKFSFKRKERRASIQRHIVDNTAFPAQTLILCVEGDNYQFGRKFRWMSGSRVV